METQPVIAKQERIDDIPLLFGMMRRMKIAEILDKHMPRHHLQQGLSSGDLAVGWIRFILTQSDHRKSAVQDWANGLDHTLGALFGCSLRPHEFSDDRLGYSGPHCLDKKRAILRYSSSGRRDRDTFAGCRAGPLALAW